MLFANIVINYEFENRTYKPNTICRNINKLLAESKEKSGEKPTESGEKKYGGKFSKDGLMLIS